jgi:hypothetical protein
MALAIDGYARGTDCTMRSETVLGFNPWAVLADVELKPLAAGDRFRIRDELRVGQTDTDSP